MPGFTATPGTSVQPISSGTLSGPQKPAAAVSEIGGGAPYPRLDKCRGIDT
jgi:hypothetical protein